MSHGTPLSEYPGWYINFQAAILKQLPRPGSIDQVTAEGWEKNQVGLRLVLGECLLPPESDVFAQSVAKRTLTTWKKIPVGGLSQADLIREVRRSCEEVTKDAEFIILNRFFPRNPRRDIDFVTLTTQELGFKFAPKTGSFMTPEFCRNWSDKYLDGQEIALCETEDAAYIRIDYKNQPSSDSLLIAMDPVKGSDGRPANFFVQRRSDGDRIIRTFPAHPEDYQHSGASIVFRLRKLPPPVAP